MEITLFAKTSINKNHRQRTVLIHKTKFFTAAPDSQAIAMRCKSEMVFRADSRIKQINFSSAAYKCQKLSPQRKS